MHCDRFNFRKFLLHSFLCVWSVGTEKKKFNKKRKYMNITNGISNVSTLLQDNRSLICNSKLNSKM